MLRLVLVGLEILCEFKLILPVLPLDLVGQDDELLPKSLFRAAGGRLDDLVNVFGLGLDDVGFGGLFGLLEVGLT